MLRKRSRHAELTDTLRVLHIIQATKQKKSRCQIKKLHCSRRRPRQSKTYLHVLSGVLRGARAASNESSNNRKLTITQSFTQTEQEKLGPTYCGQNRDSLLISMQKVRRK